MAAEAALRAAIGPVQAVPARERASIAPARAVPVNGTRSAAEVTVLILGGRGHLETSAPDEWRAWKLRAAGLVWAAEAARG